MKENSNKWLRFSKTTRLALSAGRISTICLALFFTFFATMNNASSHEEIVNILHESAWNGRIVEGLGYTNRNGPDAIVPGKKFRVYNGDYGPNIQFENLRIATRFDFSISVYHCEDCVDTESMHKMLRSRPLVRIEFDMENDNSLLGGDVTTVKHTSEELTKRVEFFSPEVVKYFSRTEYNDIYEQEVITRLSEDVAYYKFLAPGWYVAGWYDENRPDNVISSVQTLLEKMEIVRQNSLEVLINRGALNNGGNGATPIGPNSQNPPVHNTPEQLSAKEITVAIGAALAGGIAGLGAWLMLGQTGVGRREALEALGELLRGRVISDGFGDWKSRHEAMGWAYKEQDGVAWFEPPPGYSEAPPAVEQESVTYRDGDVNPDTDEVWSDEDRGWVGRNLYEQNKRRASDLAEIERRSAQATARYDAQTQALDAQIAASARDRMARELAEAAKRQRLGEKLTELYEAQGRSTDEIQQLRFNEDTFGLESLYEDALYEKMKDASANAQYWNRWAKIHGAAEFGSRVVLAGAKAGMMAVTGPAGYIPAAVGSGVLRSAEEGANAFVESHGSKAALGKALVSGLVSGIKDGVVGRFSSLPGASNGVRVALPMAADATETAIRTGDVKATLTTVVTSGLGGKVGTRIDKFGNAAVRELAHSGSSAVIGGTASVVQGGEFSDGAINGLAESIGGRAGAHIGSRSVPMTVEELRMDQEFYQKMERGRDRINKLQSAIDSGDQSRINTALHDVLDNREAKLIMKGESLYGKGDTDHAKQQFETLQKQFGQLTKEHRDQPLVQGMVDELNAQTFENGGVSEPKFVVIDESGLERPIRPDDFASGSASDQGPGMDFDVFATTDDAGSIRIFNQEEGRLATSGEIDEALTFSADRNAIDRDAQEINLTGLDSKENYPVKPGQDPKKYLASIKDRKYVDAEEGTALWEVAENKIQEAKKLHGGGFNSSLESEIARVASKEHNRVNVSIQQGTVGVTADQELDLRQAVTRETVPGIIEDAGKGRIAPGEANAKLRHMTDGKTLRENADIMVKTPEKLGAFGTQGDAAPIEPIDTGMTSRQGLQSVAAKAVRDAAEEAKDG